jgi:hypothetical protein
MVVSGARDILLSLKYQDQIWGSLSLIFKWYRVNGALSLGEGGSKNSS